MSETECWRGHCFDMLYSMNSFRVLGSGCCGTTGFGVRQEVNGYGVWVALAHVLDREKLGRQTNLGRVMFT